MKKLEKISFNWRYKDQLLHLDDLAIYGLEFLHVLSATFDGTIWFNRGRAILPAPEQLMLISQNVVLEMIIIEPAK